MRKLLILFTLVVASATTAAPVVVPAARTASGEVTAVLPVITVDTTGAYVAPGGGAYTGPAAAQLPAALGATTSANSLSVTPASNATFTVGLPTGAATSANQTALSAQIPATLGAKTSAASLSVTPASDAIYQTASTGYSFAHISTATTATVKSGAGVLHTLTVNNLGTVASVTTVYDNTAGSGTVIAVINTLAGQESYIYDVAFATGLTIVTTGTVAPDITVSYR